MAKRKRTKGKAMPVANQDKLVAALGKRLTRAWDITRLLDETEQQARDMPFTLMIEETSSKFQAASALSCCRVAACVTRMALIILRPLGVT